MNIVNEMFVYCAECGMHLTIKNVEQDIAQMTGNPLIVFYVEPCMRCTAEAAKENYN